MDYKGGDCNLEDEQGKEFLDEGDRTLLYEIASQMADFNPKEKSMHKNEC